MTAGTLISLELTQDEGDGEGFFQDVAGMVEIIARLLPVDLETVTSTNTSRVYRVLGDELPARLFRELGTHRAQLIRPHDHAGRVVTAKVRISHENDSDKASRDLILKTYNYTTRRVVFHQTGGASSLEEILAGRDPRE